MTDPDVKSTPLAAKHVELGARMVPFAGWNMPVQYTGILDEHKAVREACGIFDISHMGQFTVAGAAAAAWLNSMLTNDINKLDIARGNTPSCSMTGPESLMTSSCTGWSRKPSSWW